MRAMALVLGQQEDYPDDVVVIQDSFRRIATVGDLTDFLTNMADKLEHGGNGIRADDIQAGGSHYKDMAIQPAEFIYKNNMDFLSGNVVKYISRWKNKNGIEDLKKAKHYIDLIIEFEYGNRE